MSSASRLRALAAAAAWLVIAASAAADTATAPAGKLRVCADPNNLPFSNEKQQGFENELAKLVAHDLGLELEYTWWPQRRGFIKNTLRAGRCDVVMGVPKGFELAQTTAPYYRSTYVFVTRRGGESVQSFDDSKLRRLRIGVHVIGDDYANVPPAEALSARGIVANVRGYPIYGNYSRPDPPRNLLDALARGEIDVAIAWGPLAGYFAKRESVPMRIVPVPPEPGPLARMSFEISMAVRRGDAALERALEQVIAHRRADIHKLLARYGVPVLEPAKAVQQARAEAMR